MAGDCTIYAGRLKEFLSTLIGAIESIEAIDTLDEPRTCFELFERLRPLIVAIEPAYEVALERAEKMAAKHD